VKSIKPLQSWQARKRLKINHEDQLVIELMTKMQVL
jgi:hypothetical protein